MDRSVRLAYKLFSPDAVHKFNHAEQSHKVCKKLPPVILLHGITNTKETWDDCGQAIANRTGTTVYSLDARNHGNSEWADKINYINMAEDVVCFMDSMGISTTIIVGHSMGGKTVMCFALRHPHRLHSMIVEDMSLNYPKSVDDSVRDYFVLLREVLHKIPPKADLLEAKRIAARYLSPEVRKEDQTNLNAWDGRDLPLVQTDSGFEWKTNLDAIQGSIERDEFTPPNLLEGTGRDEKEAVYDGPVLLIYGTISPLNVYGRHKLFIVRLVKTQITMSFQYFHTVGIVTNSLSSAS